MGRRFVERLRGLSYHADGFARAFGLRPDQVPRFPDAEGALHLIDAPLRPLVELFWRGRPTPAEALAPHVPGPEVVAWERHGLVRRAVGGWLEADVQVTPWRNLLLLSDVPPATAPFPPDLVHTPELTTRALARQIPRCTPSLLDLGCGSGLFTISAAAAGGRAVGTDVNPRAIAMARLNAVLNDVGESRSDSLERSAGRIAVTGASFQAGSLYRPIPRGERFRTIVGNLPFIPTIGPAILTHHAGPQGNGLLPAAFRGLDAHADEAATAHFSAIGHDGARPRQLAALHSLPGLERFHLILLMGPMLPSVELLRGQYGYAAKRLGGAASVHRKRLERHVRMLSLGGIRALATAFVHLSRTEGRPVRWELGFDLCDALDAGLTSSLLALAERVARPGWREELRRARPTLATGLELHRVRLGSAHRPRWEVWFGGDDPRRSAKVSEAVAEALHHADGRRSLGTLLGRLGSSRDAVALDMVRRGWLSAPGWTVRWT